MRVFIIGGPGSGKTYSGRKLSKILNIDHHQIDEFLWAKNDKNYTKQRNHAERDKIIKKIVSKKDWIIEGASIYNWLMPFIKKSDVVVILHSNPIIRSFRIIIRYFQIMFGTKKGKKTSLYSLFRFIKWNLQYNSKRMCEIKKILKSCKHKVKEFSKADELINYCKLNKHK